MPSMLAGTSDVDLDKLCRTITVDQALGSDRRLYVKDLP
jgi:hypothetical protein